MSDELDYFQKLGNRPQTDTQKRCGGEMKRC